MLTLKELNDLCVSAENLERKANDKDTRAKRIAGIRNGEFKLTRWLSDCASYNNESADLIRNVIDEHSADLLRLIEMRLAAEARELRVSAQIKREQLATIVAPEQKEAA